MVDKGNVERGRRAEAHTSHAVFRIAEEKEGGKGSLLSLSLLAVICEELSTSGSERRRRKIDHILGRGGEEGGGEEKEREREQTVHKGGPAEKAAAATTIARSVAHRRRRRRRRRRRSKSRKHFCTPHPTATDHILYVSSMAQRTHTRRGHCRPSKDLFSVFLDDEFCSRGGRKTFVRCFPPPSKTVEGGSPMEYSRRGRHAWT